MVGHFLAYRARARLLTNAALRSCGHTISPAIFIPSSTGVVSALSALASSCARSPGVGSWLSAELCLPPLRVHHQNKYVGGKSHRLLNGPGPDSDQSRTRNGYLSVRTESSIVNSSSALRPTIVIAIVRLGTDLPNSAWYSVSSIDIVDWAFERTAKRPLG